MEQQAIVLNTVESHYVEFEGSVSLNWTCPKFEKPNWTMTMPTLKITEQTTFKAIDSNSHQMTPVTNTSNT